MRKRPSAWPCRGLALAGCGEGDQQVVVYKQGKYQGKPDGLPWNSDSPIAELRGGKWTKGDRASWEDADQAAPARAARAQTHLSVDRAASTRGGSMNSFSRLCLAVLLSAARRRGARPDAGRARQGAAAARSRPSPATTRRSGARCARASRSTPASGRETKCREHRRASWCSRAGRDLAADPQRPGDVLRRLAGGAGAARDRRASTSPSGRSSCTTSRPGA